MCAVLDNINQITSAECYQKKKTGHGIIGTPMPKWFSYQLPRWDGKYTYTTYDHVWKANTIPTW